MAYKIRKALCVALDFVSCAVNPRPCTTKEDVSAVFKEYKLHDPSGAQRFLDSAKTVAGVAGKDIMCPSELPHSYYESFYRGLSESVDKCVIRNTTARESAAPVTSHSTPRAQHG